MPCVTEKFPDLNDTFIQQIQMDQGPPKGQKILTMKVQLSIICEKRPRQERKI